MNCRITEIHRRTFQGEMIPLGLYRIEEAVGSGLYITWDNLFASRESAQAYLEKISKKLLQSLK